MTIYVDSQYCCHTEKTREDYRPFHVSFFDGKCPELIQGYRYIPAGESWFHPDGVTIHGETISPWKDFSQLDAAQRQYEQARILDMQQALGVLGVTLDA